MRGKGWPDGESLEIPRPNRDKILRLRWFKWKANPRCHYCGVSLKWEECTLDHVVPVSKGGCTNSANTVIACGPCNNRKGDK